MVENSNLDSSRSGRERSCISFLLKKFQDKFKASTVQIVCERRRNDCPLQFAKVKMPKIEFFGRKTMEETLLESEIKFTNTSKQSWEFDPTFSLLDLELNLTVICPPSQKTIPFPKEFLISFVQNKEDAIKLITTPSFREVTILFYNDKDSSEFSSLPVDSKIWALVWVKAEIFSKDHNRLLILEYEKKVAGERELREKQLSEERKALEQMKKENEDLREKLKRYEENH